MAKAKQAPDINHFADPQEWSAEILRLRFDEAVSFGGSALVPWNVNGVHDLRVALRRLRSALRDFEQVIDEKQLKPVRRELRKIANSLGIVRDRDVAIIALEKLAVEADDLSIRSGINELVEEFRIERERAHIRSQKNLSVRSLSDIRERFEATINDTVRQQELFRPPGLKETAREVIEARVHDLCILSSSIYTPFDSLKLHELRIAAKRLRYAIELFAACWDNKIGGFAAEVSKMQSYLGEVHDCDLWIDDLARRLTRKVPGKETDDEKSAAASWLLSRYVQKRSMEYRRALDLWREWAGNGFVDRLRVELQK